MKHYYKQSVAKFEPNTINEDAARAAEGLIAVSDGAGGGGVYAERWSRYLIKCLPSKPILSFEQFNAWVLSIYEKFYNECEVDAKKQGGLFLQKFYDEGSYATLAAAWRTDKCHWHWLTYGDSVVFCYDRQHRRLLHSGIRLAEFNNPPYLVSDIFPMQEAGFRQGDFEVNRSCIVFAASDTLAHYILMLYELSRPCEFATEIHKALTAHTKNSNFIQTAGRANMKFHKVLQALLRSAAKPQTFVHCIQKAKGMAMLGHDDYSLAIYKMKHA